MFFPLPSPPQRLSHEEFREGHEALLSTVPRSRSIQEKFHGVKLSKIDDLEKLYEVNIQVYNLAPTQTHGEEEDEEETRPDIAAILLRRSHRHYESTLYLNLYGKHFSYIKDLARYSKSFCCSRCGKYWKGTNKLRRRVKAKSSSSTQVVRIMFRKPSLMN